MAKFYFYVVFLFVFLVHISSASKCIKEDPCSCTIDEYSFLNLSKLRPSEKTFFQDGFSDVSYFFSGCEDKPFIAKDYNLISNYTIQAVSLVKCNLRTSHEVYNGTFHYDVVTHVCKPIGYAKEIKFDLVSGSTTEYQIIYVNKPLNKSSPSIHLDCNTNNNETELKILNSDTDVLILYSPLVCVQHISHHELSSGSIFCIIFFVAAIAYFIGGGMIMYFVRGAKGIEVIPNFDFWTSLPGLIKDGLVYILSGCRPFTVSSAETYDRI